MKNKVTLIKKSVSLLLAIALLVSAFSVVTAFAADTNGYYKTLASVDYEQANPLTSKVENISVTTLSNGSTGYLHANPQTNVPVGADIPITGIEQNATYTYKLDFYILEYSNDAGGCLIAPFVSGNNGYESQAWLGKDKYNLNQWYTYSTTFTVVNSYTNFKTTINTYGEANVIYDNLKIVDEDGNVVFSEDFETEKYTLPDGFSYIYDYSNGSVDANDKALHLTNETDANVNGTIGEFPLGVESTRTNYTVSYDYLIIKKATSGSNDFAFKYSSYCSECQGNIAEHKPQGDKEHYIGSGRETNVWYSDKLEIYFDDKCDNTYAQVSLYPGTEMIIDNIVVTDAEGNIVKKFDMDSGSVTGNIVRGSFGGDVEFPVKNELIWLKGAPNVVDGHISVDTTDLKATYKAIDIDFEATQAIGASSYPTLTFDYKLNGTPNTTNGVAIAVSFNGITEPSYSRNFINLTDTSGEWVTADATNFTNLDVREGANTLNLLVYGGMNLEIDNIKLTNSGVVVANIDFATNGTFEEESEREVSTVDTAMLVDTTSVADDGGSNQNFWFNELGMNNHNNQLVSGEQYTITFDVYPLEKPTVQNNFFHYRTSNGPDSTMAGWWGSDLEVGKWQTTSNTFTVEDATKTGNHVLYVYGGFNGYIDNLKLVDKNGNEVDKTYTDFGALTVPNKYISYLTMTSEFPAKPVEAPVVTGDNYDVEFITDNIGIKTYGSNGVLHIATDKWMGYTLCNATIGVDILAGKKYRLSFDYDVITPGTNTSEWSIAMVEVKTDKEGDHNDYVTTAVPVSGSKSYEFTCAKNNNVYLAVNAGCEVVIDNILLEEFVNFPTLGVQKRGNADDATVSALAYGMQLKVDDGAEYIYDINGNAIEVAEKGFITVLSNHIDGDLTLDEADSNPFVTVVKVTAPAETVILDETTHNVYTLAVTDPELDRSITVRTYVLGTDGAVYYGDTVSSAANDLADEELNTWIGAAVAQ